MLGAEKSVLQRLYNNLSGEVEARNTQKRMKMTAEERRASLAEETEDVARKDQIFIMDNLGESHMGTKVDKRMQSIGEYYKNKKLSDEQKVVIDVFSGNKDNQPLSVTRADGKRTIIMRQGTENKAGTKHSLFRHYETNSGVITAEDIALIPQIVQKGDLKEVKGGKGFEYVFEKDGVRYKVYTEFNSKSKKEEFCDFYSNKKPQGANSSISNRDALNGNTQSSARITSPQVSDAKIVNEFDNPSIDEENLQRTSEKTGQSSTSAIVDSVRLLADRLHLGNVEIVTDASALSGKEARAKGFYTKSTGKITIVVPNNANAEDAVQTLLHEAVAHYGLRQLFGSEFDNFLDAVLENADKEVLERIYDLAQANGWDYRKATEEYLATLAETTEFENTDKGWWNKVKKLFVEMLRKLGIKALDGTTLTDNELRYILWASYQNLNGTNDSLIGLANDIVKREELGIEKSEDDLLLRSDEEQQVSYEQAIVRDIYDQRMASGVYQSIEALQDSMRSVKEFMGMVDKAENGKARYIEDVDDFENAYLGENRLSSQNKAETDLSANLLFKPLLKAMTIWIFQHINCHKIHSEYIKGQ